jgi:hypothetical protein
MKKYNLFILLLSIGIILSCSSNDDNNPTESQDEFPAYEINFISKDCPESINTLAEEGNFAASMALSAYETFDAINNFGNEVTFQKGMSKISIVLLETFNLRKTNRIYTKEYNVDGVTITLMQEITSEYVLGEVTLNGKHSSSGVEFNSWLNSEVMAFINDFEGTFTAYHPNSEVPSVSVDWNDDMPGMKIINMDINDLTGMFNFDLTISYFHVTDVMVMRGEMSNDSMSFDMKINPDGTGEYTLWGPGGTVLEERTF